MANPPPIASTDADSAFDASAFVDAQAPRVREPPRWIGWRLRLLVLLALLGCTAAFAVLRLVATSAHLEGGWQLGARGQLTLPASRDEALQPLVGRTVVAIAAVGAAPGGAVPLDEAALPRSTRWMVDDAGRERHRQRQSQLAALLAQGRVELRFADGSAAPLPAPPRGAAGLGPLFWPLTALALLLHLVASAVVLRRPEPRNALYAVMAWCQAANLMLIAALPSSGLGLPAAFAAHEGALRGLLDVVTAAAALGAYALHPRPLPHGRAIVALAWAVAAAWAGAVALGAVGAWWWTTQAVVLGLGAAALAVVSWSYRLSPDPSVAVLRRLTAFAVGTLALVTLAVAATHRSPGTAPELASVGTLVWTLFFASLLLLVPFLSGPRRVLREFALLAGIGTVATSLALVFVALFALGPLASLALAAGLALLVYAVARPWILKRMMGGSVLSTERTFERLYRVARELHDHPEQWTALLSRLMQELFEPQQMQRVPRRLPAARVVGAGSALVLPLPAEPGGSDFDQVLVMRHAGRGQRIFTQDDARLAELVIEQLGVAVAHDRAVEQGRAEERLRIAQDLHDDIGARLLTMMYKATDREMEEYLRHTLQDLKTLTRGLAASSHTLSDAAGEWKADLEQRLAAARLRLEWDFQADREVTLNVVQWSGLTRILRELVSNAIYHAQASRVAVSLVHEDGWLVLQVADDGRGGDPAAWSHGLGLGGVRKRVRLLGGSVQWQSNGGSGIRCEVRLPGIGAPGGDAA